MRTYRPRALSTVLAVLAAVIAIGCGLVTAGHAAAAGVAPLAPIALHPDGTAPFEQYLASPVTFTAEVSPDDGAAEPGRVHYAVQQRSGSGWGAATTVVGQAPRIALPDGETRWRARLESFDGTLGPWSPSIRFTVDSRSPGNPTVTIPAGTVTVGVPVPVTITSPDGLASMFYLSDQGVPVVPVEGQDPCRIAGMVCVSAGQTRVTTPWTFLEYGFPRLYVTAYAPNGLMSDTVVVAPGLTAPDDAALSAATRWPIPTTSGPATSVRDVHHGTGLRIGPTLDVTTQQISTVDDATVDVPSAVIGAQTTMRSVMPVIDTAATFSVGAVLTVPADPHPDVSVFGQSGDGGSAFSLVLTATDAWKFCVTNIEAVTVCSWHSVNPFDASSVVVGRYDSVRHVVSVAVDFSEAQVEGWGTVAPARPAPTSLRFGVAALPGTRHYTGPVGNPFVARGWVSARQVIDLLAAP